MAPSLSPMEADQSMILVEEPAKKAALPAAKWFRPFSLKVDFITPSRTIRQAQREHADHRVDEQEAQRNERRQQHGSGHSLRCKMFVPMLL